jgi:hypothetical protein
LSGHIRGTEPSRQPRELAPLNNGGKTSLTNSPTKTPF